jgi:hypothetical protein
LDAGELRDNINAGVEQLHRFVDEDGIGIYHRRNIFLLVLVLLEDDERGCLGDAGLLQVLELERRTLEVVNLRVLIDLDLDLRRDGVRMQNNYGLYGL